MIGAVSAALLAAGCNVISSRPVGEGYYAQNSIQSAGTYFLPKHLVKVAIGSAGISASTIAVQDKSAQLDIGLNLLATSDDKVSVEYDANGLLSKVDMKVSDQTGEIVKQVAKTVGYFRNAAEAQSAEVKAEVTFDPFDLADARRQNQVINKLSPGSCVEVEIAAGLWSGGCRGAYAFGRRTSPADYGLLPAVMPESPGVYYRRPLQHRVHVISRGKTTSLRPEKFANLAPIIRLDFNRAALVEAKTTVVFANGEPTQFTVEKPSEALAAAKLPIAVAQAVIGGVVQAISDHTDVQKAQANLLTAQKSVVEEEAKLVAAKAKVLAESGVAADTVGGTDLSAVFQRSAGFGVGPGVVQNGMRRGSMTLEQCMQLFPESTREQCAEAVAGQR